jgi:hypothetical protein
LLTLLSHWGIDVLVFNLLKKNKPSPMNKEQFSKFLSGFIDGEGNFQVYLNKEYLRVMFRIRLHVDDIPVLYTIHKFLGVGRVVMEGDSCLFVISDKESLLNVLFPILETNKLYTTKWLDYMDFKSVVLFLSTLNTTRLSPSELDWVNSIISNMNSQRKTYDYNLIPNFIVDPFWLLGFIEGEGTFGYKNLSPYFQIGQNIRNSHVLETIANYLQLLPKCFTFTQYSKIDKIHSTLNNRTSVSVISILNIDSLYDYLMFFLLSMPFQTRKSQDFYFWCLVLHLHKIGYFYLPEGRILVQKISQYANKGRYSNNSNPINAPTLSEINEVLSLNVPIKLEPHMLHTELAKSIGTLLKPKGIWVYDNGILLNDSPFTSFNLAMEAIGYSRTSIAGRRSIDTGKWIGGRYSFYSKPL